MGINDIVKQAKKKGLSKSETVNLLKTKGYNDREINEGFGEKPKISINTTLNQITLNIAFSKKILDKNKDLEDTIRDYIGDFYPMINLEKLEIELKEKEPEEPDKE